MVKKRLPKKGTGGVFYIVSKGDDENRQITKRFMNL